ncbi:MAG: carbamoyltransferase [Candidatus Solincola sediminis]|uniref:Carbamoyltransferase n=1 Tax=Candidatus Solincola sediminis TaxID=1797199 RepID=A0A1F2WHP0_9ACTN|nr:MAG: carbamoyltransferase [Candidatus Solincola sediminis]OFW61701.1 MAG: carbamoyltransferase [Candidatus Solincola sediminis]
MYTLGINAAFHDPAACLVWNGQVVAAAEEERFSRIKHGKRPVPFSAYELPFNAIDYCLREGKITLSDIHHVAYSLDPSILMPDYAGSGDIRLPLEPSANPVGPPWDSAWDPLFTSYIVNAPRQLVGAVPHHLKERLKAKNAGYQWHFVEHHLAHAASAFIPSPFDHAAVLTIDGRGERATTTYNLAVRSRKGRVNITRLGQVEMPHSLGLLYESITDHLGFLHSCDEYKVMALASFGKPRYMEDFDQIIRLGGSGSYRIETGDLEERFGPARNRGEQFEQRHYDIASSLQTALEKAILEITYWLREETGFKSLCMAGGVALNCVMNAHLRDDGPFDEIWIQPVAGDAGTALGAALWIDAGEHDLGFFPGWRMDHTLLGPAFNDREIEDFLIRSKLLYHRLDDIPGETANLLAQGKIVGWFQGRMEFGPRALGARSILASPLDASMQQKLNGIKDREDFRPVAPVVLEEEASNWFACSGPSPFMLFVHDVLPRRIDLIPAVKHVDGSARIQTINRGQNRLYYDLVREFGRLTGVPILVNTSFNTRDEPIVCTPRDALESFCTSPLDALVIGSFLLSKSGRSAGPQVAR